MTEKQDLNEDDKQDLNKDEKHQYAGGIKRVTAGSGGEALLIMGSEKTVLIDCGMAFCAEKMEENVKKELGSRPLDYVILTHTHYDHIGGLPYLRKVWPELTSYGAAYGKKVLEKDSALKRIKSLSSIAWKQYRPQKDEPNVLMEGMKIDQAIGENDVISLGDKEIHIVETPGHTTCSISLLLEPEQIFFPSETSGVYIGNGIIRTGMLKSCRQTIASIEKCSKIKAKYIIGPHYGQVPDRDAEKYWELAMEAVNNSKNFILGHKKKGASFDEILEEYTNEFWSDMVAREQPKEAFLLNAQHRIQNVLKEYDEV